MLTICENMGKGNHLKKIKNGWMFEKMRHMFEKKVHMFESTLACLKEHLHA